MGSLVAAAILATDYRVTVGIAWWRVALILLLVLSVYLVRRR